MGPFQTNGHIQSSAQANLLKLTVGFSFSLAAHGRNFLQPVVGQAEGFFRRLVSNRLRCAAGLNEIPVTIGGAQNLDSLWGKKRGPGQRHKLLATQRSAIFNLCLILIVMHMCFFIIFIFFIFAWCPDMEVWFCGNCPAVPLSCALLCAQVFWSVYNWRSLKPRRPTRLCLVMFCNA